MRGWDTFKKYGITVSAVVLAVITTIGVIVSSLTGGLKSVVKGVEHGFKTLGSKIGGILQGLVDSVLGFVFKPARSVIGFLSENAFILIMDVAISMFEQIKKKNWIVKAETMSATDINLILIVSRLDSPTLQVCGGDFTCLAVKVDPSRTGKDQGLGGFRVESSLCQSLMDLHSFARLPLI